MRRNQFNELIDNNRFIELFNEMGWNHARNSQSIYLTIDDTDYDFKPIAEKCGFQVFSCCLPVIPTAAECKKIDNQLRKDAYDYICIFTQGNSSHHLWLTPVKTNEKRELVKTEYVGGDKADFLWSKVHDLSFDIQDVVTLPDVKENVQSAFHLNSEDVTKKFYTEFRKQHKAFAKKIQGLDIPAPEDEKPEQEKERLKKEEDNRDWYTSVMLNRLMFCYFIQKKGFLDGDFNYLVHKLKWVKQKKGEDKFFGTFYKKFLSIMFHDGLNAPNHDNDPKFREMYGRIPYLNGGMFEEHQLEQEYQGIDIPDEAFETLFAFFDKWNWHLDTRLTASGKDINPDVLGYIFEQYINDRAAMGAYYTKEDITEYIGKNCILPFLMDKTEHATTDSAKDFRPDGYVWTMLRQSGMKYIYDAVKKGYTPDWQNRIPQNIRVGIDTTQGNLLERRKDWNTKTAPEFALPTEIWRETIERLQRCDNLRDIISNYALSPSGESKGGSINDFITYNLDIRQFVEDLIRNAKDHRFVEHFYHALQKVTILDPTCGSGAFLFAALNILEPLYEACLDRMEEWHRQQPTLFVKELEEITAKYSSNRQYFIYKSIILRNLYGVDIMVEATEIAKLRLFLKMVAVVEVDKRKDNLGLDPLPDIDFNIKCGNTLVGYATQKELDKALIYGDAYAQQKFKKDIETKMQLVASAYSLFREEQLKPYDDNASIKATKDALRSRLKELNTLLNKHMYQSIAYSSKYSTWEKTHQPFHWLAEFYQIIKGNGGFDVIIGNPPYVKITSAGLPYQPSNTLVKSIDCGDLFGYCLERFTYLSKNIGVIIPLSLTSTTKMRKLKEYVCFKSDFIWNAYYSASAQPSTLFEGVRHRLMTSIMQIGDKNYTSYSTDFLKWLVPERKSLFSSRIFYEMNNSLTKLCKVSSKTETAILEKVNKEESLALWIKDYGSPLYYHNAPVSWGKVFDFIPLYQVGNNAPVQSSHLKTIYALDKNKANVLICVLNSTLFYWYNWQYSNCRDLSLGNINAMRLNRNLPNSSVFVNLCESLMRDYKKNSSLYYRVTNGQQTKFDSFYPAKSKPIIDEIDKVLARHYGFTEEELDFIINYDIKYRMGDEL